MHPDGNMLSDGTNSLVWDARNESASMNGGTISFQYDAFGRRIAKTISGTTTNYLYDGVNPVQELSGATVAANLMTGLSVDEFFTRTDSGGARNLLTDPLGSTLALADSLGALQTQYTYEPFGNTTVSGTASTNPYQYTSRENDATGLYFYRARYYNPMFRRFITQDPIGMLGGVNPYAYAGDDPVDYADPSGNFIGPVHKWVTRNAAESAGYSPEAAEALAQQVADVDNRPGSQDTDAVDANTHAMSGRKHNGKYQNCQQAYEGAQKEIADAITSNDIPKALHTIQDSYAPFHRYQPWGGGIPVVLGPDPDDPTVTPAETTTPGPIHIAGDVDPLAAMAAEAASAQFLKDLAASRAGGPPLNPANYLYPAARACGPR